MGIAQTKSSNPSNNMHQKNDDENLDAIPVFDVKTWEKIADVKKTQNVVYSMYFLKDATWEKIADVEKKKIVFTSESKISEIAEVNLDIINYIADDIKNNPCRPCDFDLKLKEIGTTKYINFEIEEARGATVYF